MTSKDFIRQSDGLGSAAAKSQSFWRIIHTDPSLLVGLLLLCAFGLFVLFSASGRDEGVVQRQGLTMIVGIVVMFVVAQFNVHFFRRWAPSMYAAGIALLGVVLLIGVEAKGAKSWLDLPGLPSFQPSELMKFVLPMLVAWYLASRPLPPQI